MNDTNKPENPDKITGKQILSDLEKLLLNVGEYLIQIGKTVYVKVKIALSEKDKKNDDDGDCVIVEKPDEKAQ